MNGDNMEEKTVKNKYHYKEIEDYIMDGIYSEKFPANSMLPTEKELCEMFHVSRMTVNKALNNIAEKGFVERVRGSGSFVKLPNLERDIVTMTSFTEQQRRKGVKVHTKLLAYSVMRAKDFPHLKLAKKLCINPDDMIHYFVRIRYGNDKPIAYQYTYVPVSRISNIDITYLNKSFYEYIEKKLGLTLGNGESFLRVVLPSDTVAKHLEISNDTPVVFVHHVSCFKNGLPFEYVDTYNVWDGYSLNFYNKREY